MKFMLTPYGNGYVHYKSISLNAREWKTGDFLNDAINNERTEALTIKELVELTINDVSKGD